MRLLFTLIFSLFVLKNNAWAAACCGGGSTAPSIISSDDKAQLSTSYSYSEVVIDNVDTNGIWRSWDTHQQIETFRIEAAHLISDLWQAGIAVPIIQRTRLDQKYSGLGDVTGTLGYEYLPDWDYNSYRPKGIGILQITLPTGKAKAESENGGLDSRGNGFLAISLGTLLTKSIRAWDLFSNFEIHRSFEKKVSSNQISGTLKPGYGGNFGLGIGYNTAQWRWGGSMTWMYEDPIKTQGVINNNGSIERYATGALSVSYLASSDWAGSMIYSDQTLFGSPVNTSLGKTLSLQLQKKWAR